MTITVHYNTKKDLKNNVGSELDYTETNIFKDEYTENGTVIGCDINRKFFAKITIKNNIIERVQ
mgnify:FL=1|tara:strand:+ start:464 stop:655 length:192 start_codon:yes stop_codon:yes gene_type:complete